MVTVLGASIFFRFAEFELFPLELVAFGFAEEFVEDFVDCFGLEDVDEHVWCLGTGGFSGVDGNSGFGKDVGLKIETCIKAYLFIIMELRRTQWFVRSG